MSPFGEKSMLFMRSEFSRKTLATLKLLTTWSTSFMVMDGAFSLSCRPLNLPASAISFSFLLIWPRRRGAKLPWRGQGFGLCTTVIHLAGKKKSAGSSRGQRNRNDAELSACLLFAFLTILFLGRLPFLSQSTCVSFNLTKGFFTMSPLFPTNGRRRQTSSSTHRTHKFCQLFREMDDELCTVNFLKIL